MQRRSWANLRQLVVFLTARQLMVRYRRSALGVSWALLQPLLTMLIWQAVFGRLFARRIPGYSLYVLSGLLFWGFMQRSVLSAMNSFRSNAVVLQKLPVPAAVYPVSCVLAEAVNLLIGLVPLAIIGVATGHAFGRSLVFLPLAILVGVVAVTGVALVLAPLAVLVTDLAEVVGIVMSMLLYLTPVFYPLAILPAGLFAVMRYSPLWVLLELFRGPIHGGTFPPLDLVAYGALVAAASLALGSFVFVRVAHRVPLHV